MREADRPPTPSNEKKKVWSSSSNPHVPSRREQAQLYLYFTTNVEHSRSLQRSSGDCCKSHYSYRQVPQPTPLAVAIPPSDRSWPSASKCLLTQDPFSSLTIHFSATGFYSRSSVTSRTIHNQSINQNLEHFYINYSSSAANRAHENDKCTRGTELLFSS